MLKHWWILLSDSKEAVYTFRETGGFLHALGKFASSKHLFAA